MNTAQQLSDGARAILAAASDLFALEGFDSVSVGAIAERAGVSKSNVFHHFVNKDELVLAVLREASLSHAEFAEQLLADSGSSWDKLQRLVAFEISDLIGNQQKMLLVFRALSAHSCSDGQRIAERIFKRNFRAVAALFAQGQRSGELRDDIDPAVAAMMLAGSHEAFLRFNQNLLRAGGAKRRRAIQRYIEDVFKLLLRGMVIAPADTAVSDSATVPNAATVPQEAAALLNIRPRKTAASLDKEPQ